MKYLLLLASLFLVIGCGQNGKSQQKEKASRTPLSYEVHQEGALMNFMHKGDLSSKINLATLSPENLYALGAVENLKGEILVLNGNALISRVRQKEVQIDESLENEAALLVYAHVEKWLEVGNTKSFESGGQFEKWLDSEAKKTGIDTSKPFPFLLKGKVSSLSWHVIDWPEGDTEHTHQKHVNSGLNGDLQETEVSVLGFHSKNHKGVFTHHSSNVHMHMSTTDYELAGHVDEFNPGSEMTLFLPATKN
jgi:acetolactate decarboxylase